MPYRLQVFRIIWVCSPRSFITYTQSRVEVFQIAQNQYGQIRLPFHVEKVHQKHDGNHRRNSETHGLSHTYEDSLLKEYFGGCQWQTSAFRIFLHSDLFFLIVGYLLRPLSDRITENLLPCCGHQLRNCVRSSRGLLQGRLRSNKCRCNSLSVCVFNLIIIKISLFYKKNLFFNS